MGAQHIIDAVQMPLFHNGASAPYALLRWLENQLYRAVQLAAAGGKNLRNAQADGGVPIVAAGVHAVL